MQAKFKLLIIIISLPLTVYAQDTINFKLFDSLKTKTEDSHKKINLEDSTKSVAIFKNYKEPDNIDIRLFRSINNSRSPLKTKILNTFDNSLLPVSLILPPSLFLYSRAKQHTYDENSAYLAITSEITNFAFTFGLKTLIKRKRPIQALQNVHGKQIPKFDKYSFPSGHASTSFSVATMFALRYPNEPAVYLPMFAWSLIISYGRPYFGMHYPSDVISGMLIGTGSSVLMFSLRKELLKLKNQVFSEDKSDSGTIKSGVITFFAGAFAISAIVDNFIFKDSPEKKVYISPWIGNNGSGLNLKWKP